MLLLVFRRAAKGEFHPPSALIGENDRAMRCKNAVHKLGDLCISGLDGLPNVGTSIGRKLLSGVISLAKAPAPYAVPAPMAIPASAVAPIAPTGLKSKRATPRLRKAPTRVPSMVITRMPINKNAPIATVPITHPA